METSLGSMTITRRRQELGPRVGHDGHKEQAMSPQALEGGQTGMMNIRRRQGLAVMALRRRQGQAMMAPRRRPGQAMTSTRRS